MNEMNESRAKCALVVLWTLLLLSGLWTAKAVAWAPSSPNNAERPSHAAHSVASAPRPAQIAPNTTIRISISSNGVQANGNCYYPSVSDDGRYVAFASDADNLVPGDTNGARDIFVHDLYTGQTERVSVASDGSQAEFDPENPDPPRSDNPAISGDGTYVAFDSNAINLAGTDTFGRRQVYVHNRLTGETRLVSVSTSGGAGDYNSGLPDISADGRYVAFESEAWNLVEGDTNNTSDVFVRDLIANTTVRISAPEGGQANGASHWASISGFGADVAFRSVASNLIDGDGNTLYDIFRRARTGGPLERVSESEGLPPNGTSFQSSISNDGAVIAFASLASNLVPDDTNGEQDVFVHIRGASSCVRVSVASDGSEAIGGASGRPSLSNDGYFVAFYSKATNLVDGDTNGLGDVFVHNRETGETTRVSVSTSGEQALGGDSGDYGVSISTDNKVVAFASEATNLVAGDTNGVRDIFVHVRANHPPEAHDDVAATSEETPVLIQVLANDLDLDFDPLQITSVGSLVHGTASILGDAILYTPTLDFNGVDTFHYSISDGKLNAGALVSVTVSGVNDPPVAVDDMALTPAGTPVYIPALDNDLDVDGDPLHIADVAPIADPAIGSTDTDGTTILFTPGAAFAQAVFTYTVSDGQLTAEGTITVTLNQPPVAQDDVLETDEDTPLWIFPLTNDVTEDPLTISAITQPAHGLAVIDPPTAGAAILYTPTLNYYGPDTLTYTVRDTDGLQDTATISITVWPVNDPPWASPDVVSTTEDLPLWIAVLDNDEDVEDGPSPPPLTIVAVTPPAAGQAAIQDTWIVYTPDGDYYGFDELFYTVRDSGGLTATAPVSIWVLPADDPPLARDDIASTDEDMPLSIAVLANDEDADGDPLELLTVGQPPAGVAAISDTLLLYTPTLDFCGTDVLTYTVGDGTGLSDSATVTVTVRCLNDPPRAEDDHATTQEDCPMNIAVLDNDSDVDIGDTLQVIELTAPLSGTASISGTLVLYAPHADLYGNDVFSYTVRDDQGAVAQATVWVSIAPVNDPPQAREDIAFTNQDTPVVIAVLSNDSDVDGDPLALVALGNPAHGLAAIHGVTVVYTPTQSWGGSDVFTYTVADTHGATDQAIITVTVNAAPRAVDDLASTAEETPVLIDVLANDIDEGPLTLLAVGLPLYGSATISDTRVLYTPPTDLAGTDALTYTVRDEGGLTDSATITVTIQGTNDPPFARDDQAATPEETPLLIDVLANDGDIDGDTPSLLAVDAPAHGTAAISGTVVIYTPALNWDTEDAFSYLIVDPGGLTATAQVHVVITGVNDPPLAVDDLANTPEDTSVTIDVLANDSDPDTDDALHLVAVGTPTWGTASIVSNRIVYTPATDLSGSVVLDYTVSDLGGLEDSAWVTITVSAANDPPHPLDDEVTVDEEEAALIDVLANDGDPDPGDMITLLSLTDPAHGRAWLQAGVVFYIPDGDYFGPDLFHYTVRDNAGATASATVHVTVRPVNDPPVATDDMASTHFEMPIALQVLLNDIDVDGDTLTVAGVGAPRYGTVVHDGRVITYTPGAPLVTDVFTYTITDGQYTDEGTVTVTVIELSHPPEAVDDEVALDEDTVATIAVLANDHDPDPGDALFLISVSGPLHGQAVLEGDNVRYTPNANYFGDDLFGYTVRDSGGRTDSALVRVTVQPVNDPPDAQDDTASTAAGAKVTVDVLANDSDIEGDPLTIVRLGTPSQGTATIQGRNVLYWAEVWASGTDVFTYTLSDGELEDTATVSVLISEAQAALLYLPFVRQRWPDTFVLWGRVSTEAGGSIPDALVSVRDGPSTRTDEGGYYLFGALPPGTVQVTVFKAGWDFWPSPATVLLPPHRRQDFIGVPAPTPSATATALPTPTATPSPSPTPTTTATPWPSPSPTTAHTCTPQPPPCEEAIVNGGFESDEAWVILPDARPAAFAAIAHGGSRSMRLGITEVEQNAYSHSAVEQTLILPEGTQSAVLRFWLYPLVEEEGAPDPSNLARLGRAATLWAIPLLQGNRPLAVEGDIQYVLILDEDGDTIGTLVWQRSNARIWQPYSFDLAPYAGRAIRIRLGVFNDGLGRCTAGYVDDVTLQVCALP